MRSAFQLLSDNTFQTRHFSFRGKRLPIKCAFYCGKGISERESFLEVLSTYPGSAALKLSQWHLASLTKNKSFFLLLRKQWESRDTEEGNCSNRVGASVLVISNAFQFEHWLTD